MSSERRREFVRGLFFAISAKSSKQPPTNEPTKRRHKILPAELSLALVRVSLCMLANNANVERGNPKPIPSIPFISFRLVSFHFFSFVFYSRLNSTSFLLWVLCSLLASLATAAAQLAAFYFRLLGLRSECSQNPNDAQRSKRFEKSQTEPSARGKKQPN